MNRTYLAIDLKSFYASVECIERGLDPLTTNLVVADESRTEKTICLAVSPSLKALGISGRPRLFEVNQKLKEIKMKTGEEVVYIAATPRMSYYMQYSTNIYKVYLKYVSALDIHVYSIDEVFIDVTNYLNLYHMDAKQLCITILKDVYDSTGITATAGIGTNLYLAKIAMDIVAKHIEPDENGVRIAFLDEYKFRELLWEHRPLTDFWRIGPGIARRLENNGMKCLGDVARMSLTHEEDLYKIFGIDAEIIIDHAWGYEPVTINHIKTYHSKSNSMTNGQVLSKGYTKDNARIVLKEMIEELCQKLIDNNQVTSNVGIGIGYDISSTQNYKGNLVTDHYGRQLPEGIHFSVNLGSHTSSMKRIEKPLLDKFDRSVNSKLLIRRISISFNNVIDEANSFEQFDLFTNHQDDEKDKLAEKAMINIQKKFGKSAIFKGRDLLEDATLLERNEQIGGHKSNG